MSPAPSPIVTPSRPPVITPAPDPDVLYRKQVDLEPGDVVVFGRKDVSVHGAPASGFEIWWDAQLSADAGSMTVLGEFSSTEFSRIPSWRSCRTSLDASNDEVRISPDGVIVCLDLRFAGTAVVTATARRSGGVRLDCRVWER